jgi:deoxyribonuclease-2
MKVRNKIILRILITSKFSHIQGLVVSDDVNGFWLVHSVPKFPPSKDSSYAYPESGKRNGQSFICITFPSDQLMEIGIFLIFNNQIYFQIEGKQLYVAQPNFYDAQMPASFDRLFPDLANAVNKKTYPKGKPDSSTLTLRSVGRNTFVSFSKHKRFDRGKLLTIAQ